MPDNLTTPEYRKTIPASIDPEHVWVELGPIDHNRTIKYPFPTREAAEKFAANERKRHPHREVRVV